MGTRNGYGFVTLPGRDDDIFIPEGKCGGALDGDKVAVRYRTYLRGGITHTEGTVTAILEAGRSTVIGILAEEPRYGRARHGTPKYTLLPDDTHLNAKVLVGEVGDAREGDKVEVLLDRSRSGGGVLWGRVNHSFGPAHTREANYAAILAECGIQEEFSPLALKEAEEVAGEQVSLHGREDLREEIIFTIDGADAKDLDDAISLTRTPEGEYLLGVHIADVSHYVRPKTELDATVLSRGTSVYFTDQVVPMLPPSLSNGACSLGAGEDKYALSAHLRLSPEGDILETRIARSVIRSRVRGVYSEVNDLLEKGQASPFYPKYKEVLPTLQEMYGLYKILEEKLRRGGYVELDQTEARILLDEEGMPCEIIPRERGVGERLIEQFMLSANRGVAEKMYGRHLPCVYRVHEAPDDSKVSALATYAHHLGIGRVCYGDAPTGQDFARLLENAREKGVGGPVSYMLLRTMTKAKYSEVCSPHFGLGIDRYCHFTSPIRRLSDLATHRMICATLLEGEAGGRWWGYAAKAAHAASEGELRALSAERKIDALYKALYLSERLGESYEATVTSVTRFGAFASLDNTCEGLIPISDLPGVWTFDEGSLSLRRGVGARLTLGDRIRITVEEVDLSRGKVRFGLEALPEREKKEDASSEKSSAPQKSGASQKSGTPKKSQPQKGGTKKHPAPPSRQAMKKKQGGKAGGGRKGKRR